MTTKKQELLRTVAILADIDIDINWPLGYDSRRKLRGFVICQSNVNYVTKSREYCGDVTVESP
jgi:hypothetical protein